MTIRINRSNKKQRKSIKKRSSNKKQRKSINRQRKSINRQRGGAYLDAPSFGGAVHVGNHNMDAFNTASGGTTDPLTASSIVDSRLGGSLNYKWY